MTSSILNVDNIERALVTLLGDDYTNTTQVTAASDHDGGTDLELERLCGLVRGKVNLHDVVNGDVGIRVANGAAIVQNHERDALGTELDAAHTAELPLKRVRNKYAATRPKYLCLLSANGVNSETTLGVVEETEGLVGLLNGNDV